MKIHKHTMINISDIKPYENNARMHTTEQVAQIKASIKEFGFTNPLLIDSDYNLIAGHGRLEAIKQLNNLDYKDNPIIQAPAIVVSDLSEAQYKALIIADNKIAENAYWDNDLLKQELQELELLIDLDLLGFSDSEISDILEAIDYDGLNDDFIIPSNDKPNYKQITITLKTDNAEKILTFQKNNRGGALSKGDNLNENANIIWNLLKDRL